MKRREKIKYNKNNISSKIRSIDDADEVLYDVRLNGFDIERVQEEKG